MFFNTLVKKKNIALTSDITENKPNLKNSKDPIKIDGNVSKGKLS